MRKIYFLLAIIYALNINSQDNNALFEIEFGMTKSQIKKVVKSDKDKYNSINLGGYLWRYYIQNNTYDKDGGLKLIKLTPRGGGMYGLNETSARQVFKALVRLLVKQGYTNEDININNDNPLEFIKGEVYIMSNKEKDRNIYIGLPPAATAPANIYVNCVIGKYVSPKDDVSEEESPF